MNQWEVYVADFAELVEDTPLELTIRTLNPGINKFTYKRAKCLISANLERYPDRLQVRLGRGQLSDKRYAIEVQQEVERLPAKYR